MPSLAAYLRNLPELASDIGGGAAETAATLGSGIVAQPIAGLAGLGKGAHALYRKVLRGEDVDPLDEATKAIESTQDALTYAPRGDVAQRALESIGGAVEAVSKPLRENIADPVGKFSPALGAALVAAPQVLPTGRAEAGAAAGAKAAGKAAERAAAKAAARAKELEPIPELATRYPEPGPPAWKVDPKKEEGGYWGKDLSPEELRVQKMRKAAQADIDAGKYTPYFNVEERSYVNPENYPLPGNTLTDTLAKKPETIAKHEAKYDTPEIRQRLRDAFNASKDDPAAERWYAMGQLEDKYVKELGPVKGRKAYKEDFADAMAATTGGADPKANFLTASYGNYMREKGLPFPEESHQLPHPIGGRYVGGNIDMYQKVLREENPLTAGETPKRFNFSGNFMGHRDKATIDEQMMGLFDPSGKLKAPQQGTYGVLEKILGDEAAKAGTVPENFQAVAWHKGEKEGKPMIQQVNEAIERTSRVTGVPPEEVVKRMVRRQIPIYGIGAGGVGLADILREKSDDSAAS